MGTKICKNSIFISKAKIVHGDKYDYSKVEYLNNKSKVEIICKKHGSFFQTPGSHINSCTGCPSCAGNVKHSNESFINKSKLIHNDKYDYSKVEYINAFSKIVIICPKHGFFLQAPHDHLKGAGCSQCAGTKLVSFDDFVSRSAIIHNNKYEYFKLGDEKTKSDVTVVCPIHGSFNQKINGHLNGKGCKKCAYDDLSINNRSDLKTFLDKCYEIHGNKYNYELVEYVNSRMDVTIICPKHGPFNQSPSNHIQGHGCPKCSSTISNNHVKILDLIKSLKPNVEIINNDRSVFDGLEIDIWLPEFKLGIEIHGCYWHSLRLDNTYDHSRLSNIHDNKATLAVRNNITLFQFWDYEIENKIDIISSMISHKLNLNSRIYARNCYIKKLDNGDVVDFFNSSHLQGHRNAKVTYGLFYNDELVSAASFSNNHKYYWEIMRFACKKNVGVIGGFSKLFKKFIDDYDPPQVMTFADRRISTGNVYRINGFLEVQITKPNYIYQRGKLKLSRQQCQKHKLSRLLSNYDDKLSEKDNMLINGFNKICDAGNYKLLWNK